MPELPEVETIARQLKRTLHHRSVADIKVLWARTIANLDPAVFTQNVQGTMIRNIWRRGKYLIFDLDSEKYLVIHLRMSGRFNLVGSNEVNCIHKHTRVRMVLDNGFALNYIDQRKFGRFYLVNDTNSLTHKLGPEPLSPQFTREWLAQALARRTGQIKSLLLNQQFLAGLGNIYTNEALWVSQIHPLRKANTLNPMEIKQLHNAVVTVLKQAVNHGGTSDHCERCGYQLERMVHSQRSSYFCPICQTIRITSHKKETVTS